MSRIGKGAVGGSIAAVLTVATGTPWERSFDLGVVANSPLPRQRLKRLCWTLGRWFRKRRRASVEREIAQYRQHIAREGCTPEYLAQVMASRGTSKEGC